METAAINDSFREQMAEAMLGVPLSQQASAYADQQMRLSALRLAIDAKRAGGEPSVREAATAYLSFLKTGEFAKP